MRAEEWAEIEKLFAAALPLSAADREVLLATVSPAVSDEVRSLLAADLSAASGIIAAAIGDAAERAEELATGRVLAHFKIVRLLGRGGMGEVYLATDLALGRQVALKLLPRAFQRDAERVRRFAQEARAAAILNHPNIVIVHEVGESDGRSFIATEFVDGETLASLLKRGPIPTSEATRLALQIVPALAVAHAAGIVHRDLKPGNIMLSERGQVKVLDFGLAKLMLDAGSARTASAMTVEGGILGTVDYMSPEQARGEAVDRRSDIFSFGAVFYELLTGERPFQASHPLGVLHEILSGVITPPRHRRTDISAQIDAIVMRALERDLSRRYQSLDALADDLQIAARGLLEESPSRSSNGSPGASGTRVPVLGWRHWPAPVRGSALILGALSLAALVAGSMPASREWIAQQFRDRRGTEAAAGAGVSLAPASPRAMTQEGLTLLRRFDGPKNLDGSIALFERAIAADAAYAPAHAAIAWAYTRQAAETRDKTWIARAVDAARHAVSLDPFLADAHASHGIALVAAGDHQSAATALRQAEGLDPRNGLMWFARGEMAYAQDRRSDATAAYQKATELMPDDWRPLTGIGTVAYRDGRYDDAILWYTRAAELAPDVATAHALLGSAYVMKGDFAGAAAALQKSISIRPTASAYTNLGTALFFEGRYRDSVAAFEKGVELRPADPLMWGNLGDARRWTPGGRERAADAYLRAIQLVEQQLSRDPTNVRDRSRLALYLSKRGEPAAGLGELAKIPDLASRDLDTLYRAAVTYELAGNRGEALRWLGLALERGYNIREVGADPELAALRGDVRYQRLATRFERRAGQ